MAVSSATGWSLAFRVMRMNLPAAGFLTSRCPAATGLSAHAGPAGNRHQAASSTPTIVVRLLMLIPRCLGIKHCTLAMVRERVLLGLLFTQVLQEFIITFSF